MSENATLRHPAVVFTIASGMGWCIDFGLLFLMTRHAVPAASANFISASTAALFAYLMSRKFAFGRKAKKGTALGAGLYLLYTFLIIAVFSGLLQLVATSIHSAFVHIGWNVGMEKAALVAKVLITPFNLAVNFLVARMMASRF